MTEPQQPISTDSLLTENRTFAPSPETVGRAHVTESAYDQMYRQSVDDPDGFWAEPGFKDVMGMFRSVSIGNDIGPMKKVMRVGEGFDATQLWCARLTFTARQLHLSPDLPGPAPPRIFPRDRQQTPRPHHR